MKKGNHSPRLTNAMKKRVEFLLVHEGLSQTEASTILTVSRKTIGEWNKIHKWTGKQKVKSDLVKFDDSLNAFVAFHSVKHPETKIDIDNYYQEFKNSI